MNAQLQAPNAPEPLAFEGPWELPLWRSEAFAEDLDTAAEPARMHEGAPAAAPAAWQQPLLLLVPLGTALLGLAAWMPVIVQ